MLRARSFLSVPLFLLGIAAGRHWGGGGDSPREAESREIATGAASTGSVSRTAETAGEGTDFAVRIATAALPEIKAMWDALAAEEAAAESSDEIETFRTGPWKRMLLVERWAELDGPGVLAAVKERASDLRPLLGAVFRSWAMVDASAAMEAVRAEAGDNRNAAATGWLSAWADEPAETARRAAELKWMNVSALTEEDFRGAVSGDLLRKAHAADRESLLALSGWLPPWYDAVLRELDWRAAWTKGGEEARAALESLTPSSDNIRRMARDLAPLFRTRPEEAMDLLEKLLAKGSGADWPEVRNNLWPNSPLVYEMVKTMGPRDPDRVAGLLLGKDSGGGAQLTLHLALMEGLAGTNPAAAMRLAAGLTKTDSAAAMFGAPLPPLEPAVALAAVRDAAPSWLRDKWLDRALLEMSPADAAAWVEALPEGEMRSSALLTLETRDLPEGERALRRVVSQFPRDTLDDSARGRITGTGSEAFFGADMPALTARVASWPESAARDQAVEVMATRWASFDTPEALAWTASLTDESLRAAASGGIAKTWTAADPAAASEWVDSLPPGAAREAAAGELAAGLANRDPESAARWAASLSDPRERYERLEDIVSKWASKDAAAAAAGVHALPGLADADRAALLKSLSNTP